MSGNVAGLDTLTHLRSHGGGGVFANNDIDSLSPQVRGRRLCGLFCSLALEVRVIIRNFRGAVESSGDD